MAIILCRVMQNWNMFNHHYKQKLWVYFTLSKLFGHKGGDVFGLREIMLKKTKLDNNGDYSTEIGNGLYDIWWWTSKFLQRSLDHVNRERNQAAYLLSKNAYESDLLYSRFRIPPKWLMNSLYFLFTVWSINRCIYIYILVQFLLCRLILRKFGQIISGSKRSFPSFCQWCPSQWILQVWSWEITRWFLGIDFNFVSIQL